MWIQKTIETVSQGPKFLHDAVDNAYKNKYYTANIIDKNINFASDTEINICSLYTALIHNAGRFCERYASDLLYTFMDIEPFLQCPTIEKDNRWVIGIGIRDSGIDGNTFIQSRMTQASPSPTQKLKPTQVYRKLFAVDIVDCKKNQTRQINLVDITHQIIDITEV